MESVVAALVVLGIGGILAGRALRESRKAAGETPKQASDRSAHRREIRDARRCAITEAPAGAVVRVHGRILDGETATAPLSGRPCVYFIAIVEEAVPNRSGEGSVWRERARKIGYVGFSIEDGTGRAVVDPNHARVDMIRDSESSVPGLRAASERERAFCEGCGVHAARPLRFIEGVLEVGEEIAVVGRAAREPDPDGAARAVGYREGAPHRLRFAGTEQEPLLVSESRTVTARR